MVSADRFWAHVRASSVRGCWEWSAYRKPNGYGQTTDGIRGVQQLAHRAAWALTFGPIDGNKEIDHICRNRICVNPAHLRIVPRGFNGRQGGMRAKIKRMGSAACRRGHLWTALNTYRLSDGGRECLTCRRSSNRLASARYAAKQRAKKMAQES